jgi:hypothetical protein
VTYESSDPAVIERELAESRARLDTHLDQLTKRLSPGQLIDDGLDYLRHGQGAEFVRNLGGQLRDNPLPVALTGIGLSWLMAASAMSGNGRAPYSGAPGSFDDVAARAQRAGDTLTRLADESEETFKTRVAEARAQVLGLERNAMEAASVFADRVQQAFDSAQQAARERLAQIGQTASEWGEAVADRTRRTGEAMAQAAGQSRDAVSRAATAISDAVDQNPMLLGAMGLTAGVLLAALLPVTEQEEAVAAPIGDAIRSAADQAIERGKRAAEAAAAAAHREMTSEADEPAYETE